MENARGIMTAHFIAHWGVPREIRPYQLRGVGEVAILEFAPTPSRPTWRYATNGMSALNQATDAGAVSVRTELYACTKGRAAWVDDLLIGLASYPYDYATYLSDGDTIDVGQRLDRSTSPYTGVLLGAPGAVDSPSLGLVGGLQEDVLVHEVLGLLPDEVEYVSIHGSAHVYEPLVHRSAHELDVPRDSVIQRGFRYDRG